MSEQQPAGRRAAAVGASRRRIGPAVVLAVLLPLATLGAAMLVSTEAPPVPDTPPETTTLTRLTLGCPSSPDDATAAIAVGSTLATEDGEVSVDTLGGTQSPLPVSAGELTSVDVEGAAVVTGEDDWAPGLLAARGTASAATACAEPQPDAWFAGVGARPGHSSVVELVNPDPGPAIADLTLFAPSGALDVSDLRGIRVPGRSSVELDLATVTPRRTELGLHVQVSRGRLTSAVRDSVDRLGTGPLATDWIAPQSDPVTAGTMLGLPRGDGTRRLTLVNGGDSEARVDVRVVSPESTFVPEGLDEINVPPQSVRSISLDAVLAPEVRAGALGIYFESTYPVAASLQSFVAGDLAVAATGPVLDGTGAALLPTGPHRLQLAGATRPGVATVVSRAAGGRELTSERVEIGPDRGVVVDLPDAAAYVSVELERTPAVASVLIASPQGAVVLPLTPVVASALVPAVSPTRP
jgi:hypothetical protein